MPMQIWRKTAILRLLRKCCGPASKICFSSRADGVLQVSSQSNRDYFDFSLNRPRVSLWNYNEPHSWRHAPRIKALCLPQAAPGPFLAGAAAPGAAVPVCAEAQPGGRVPAAERYVVPSAQICPHTQPGHLAPLQKAHVPGWGRSGERRGACRCIFQLLWGFAL